MPWIAGRQNSGYFKWPIFVSKLLRMDCYILKFEKGTKVPWHTDPAKTGRHYRFNMYLSRVRGGRILMKQPAIFKTRLFHLFRPDINEHCMTEVEDGTLYVF